MSDIDSSIMDGNHEYPSPQDDFDCDSSKKSSPNGIMDLIEIDPKKKPQVITIEFMNGSVLRARMRFHTSINSMYDLAVGAYDGFLREHLPYEETLHCHLWTIHYAPVRGMKITFISDDMKFAKSDVVCRPEHPVPLAQLPAFEVNDTFSFQYDFGSPTYMQWRVSKVTEATETDASHQYPIVEDVNEGRIPFDSKAECLLTLEELQESKRCRVAFESQEALEWSYAQQRYIPAQAPVWRGAESQALEMLIYAGMGFSKAWTRYLEHTLLTRSRGAASGTWYKLKKERQSYEAYFGRPEYNQAPAVLLEKAWDLLYGIRMRNLRKASLETSKQPRKRSFWGEGEGEDGAGEEVSSLTLSTDLDSRVCPLIKYAKHQDDGDY